MPFSIVHLSDPHFGQDADLPKIVAAENFVPDLQPDAVVITGDLTERARHGEFQAARAWVRELERTAPVLTIPGDHDMQWWKKPIGAAEPARVYEHYSQYFGPVVAPKLQITDALIAGASTLPGLQLMHAIKDPRKAATAGRLDRSEARRVRDLLAQAEPHQARVVVMHHHLIETAGAARSGLANSKQALQWLGEAGVDVVLCGHAHQDATDAAAGCVVSVAGTMSARVPAGAAASFHRVVIEESAVQIELYRWEKDAGRFRRTDVFVFARQRTHDGHRVTTGAV